MEKLAAYKPEETRNEGNYFYGGFDDDFDDGPMEFPRFEELQVGEGVNEMESVTSPGDSANNLVEECVTEQESALVQSQDCQQDNAIADNLDISMAELSLNVKKEQPYISKRVKPIPLIFSRSAKRVDVSKLKENLWHKLSDDAPGQGDGDITKANVTLLKEEKSFREIVTELDDCYEDKARKDISVAFCFICVLHLANENNLKITGSDEMKELIISAV